MGDNRNYAALEWVIGEIEDTLAEARKALEAFVEDPNDVSQVGFCLTHIHQVYGSLRMIEFYGAAMIAEEMESLAQALINQTVQKIDDALDVLMRGILQLPLYLEQVKTARTDYPGAVLPLLNDLRAARGESLLSESKFFFPDLTPAHRVQGQRHQVTTNAQRFSEVATKLQKMFQVAAAGLLKGVEEEKNQVYLDKVCERLVQITSGSKRQALWLVAQAFVEGIKLEVIGLSPAVKNLLKELNREIKILVKYGTRALNAYPNDDLVKNLLFYIASSPAEGSHIVNIKEDYRLDAALPAEQQSDYPVEFITAPDPDTIKSVVAALKDELESVKHILDQSREGMADVRDAVPILKRIADTLSVLGIAELREKIVAHSQALVTSLADESISAEDIVAELAANIVGFENDLDNLAEGYGSRLDNPIDISISQAHESVLRESRNGLEQAKDAIVEYIASQWNKDHLTNVPGLLTEIRGGLDMIPLTRAARVVGACSRYVDQRLLHGDLIPDWHSLDTLADAIASVEYYLERLSSDKVEGLELLLDVAEQSVERLGYAVAPSKPVVAESTSADSVDSITATDASAEALASGTESVEFDLPATPTFAIVDDELSDEDQPSDETVVTNNELAAEYVEEPAEDSAQDHVDTDIDSELVEAAERPSLYHVKVPPKSGESAAEPIPESQSPVAAPSPADDVDEEILEIFVEEAGEVTETIAEFLPRWADDFSDNEALVELRRAFHTLKGSGRLVGATDVGELAWSVENMLNRVIDGSIDAGRPHVDVIKRVTALIPTLISAFDNRQANPMVQDCELCSSWAEQLSNGSVPAALAESVPADDAPVDLSAPVNAPPSYDAEDTKETPVDLDEDDNQLLWEIFGSEAEGHLETVREFIREMDMSAPLYSPPSDAMQRALHTLKGSAHMADISAVAQLATPLERFVKELRSYQLDIDADILQLLKDGVSYVENALAQISNQQPVLIERLDQYLARIAELRELTVAPLIRSQEDIQQQNSKRVDPELLAIFMAEDMKLLLDADQQLQRWNEQGFEPADIPSLELELATLRNGADHANLPQMAALSGDLACAYDALRTGSLAFTGEVCAALTAGHNALLDMVDAVAAGQNLPDAEVNLQAVLDQIQHPETPDLEAEAEAEAEAGGGDSEEWFSISAEDLSGDDIPNIVVQSADGENNFDLASAIISNDEMSTSAEPAFDMAAADESVAEGSDVVDLGEFGFVTQEDSVTRTDEEPVVDENVADTLANDIPQWDADNSIDANDYADATDWQQDQIVDFSETLEADRLSNAPESADTGEAPVFVSEPINDVALPADDSEPAQHDSDISDSVPVVDETTEALMDAEEDIDPEIIEIFTEEADELLEEIDEAVHEWESDWSLTEPVEALKRSLHTYKGGARLAGLMALGEEAHEFETFLIDLGSASNIDQAFFEKIHHYQDLLVKGTAQVKAGQLHGAIHGNAASTPPATVSPQQDAAEADGPDLEVSATDAGDAIAGDNAEVSESTYQPADSVDAEEQAESAPPATQNNVLPFQRPEPPKAAPAQSPLQTRRSAPQELVKVPAELLEELVNLAGETAIGSGRVEEQVNEIGGALDEMEITLARLQEQLRRLDIETEAQILFRQEQMEQFDDFDPLEMDRYSQLQQLSRSLIESSSDLLDLKTTLVDKKRDTETLLLQQSRVNSELQEGLMRSRMVPFSRMVPRLRRIVRQVASELNKNVSLEMENVEGEMDRSILERMVAPLEHMLRNAVDHGIEKPPVRYERGKPESGRIVLALSREGGDVVLRIMDDGQGIDLKRVREKAIERGLMGEDSKLHDHDIMQFILHAGFSTADKVTQISGRGVGMDVVHSEIKQLGGSMTIDSVYGQGTEFVIRLPFTVSVNRALMVNVAGDRFAIPLNTIEGIVRVNPFELEYYYQNQDARFEYAGENYRVKYLGNMLNTDTQPVLEGQALPLPVVLVRSADHSVAVQVDSLMGSREIVVKSLGQQFSAVQGLSGATVMGDGSVVVILDPHAMIRKEMALVGIQAVGPTASLPAANEERQYTVMVVDDSVTVRKVTSRFLEREGFNVVTAKDGADALQQLQINVPDIMLLDIEMPRMDGFEVAKNIRSTSRLGHLPIIMITSRTGEKHRERAMELGVNRYLGKPYQEDHLLETIRELIEPQG